MTVVDGTVSFDVETIQRWINDVRLIKEVIEQLNDALLGESESNRALAVWSLAGQLHEDLEKAAEEARK